jgi:DNA-binding response OmpR family regulator
MARILLVEDDPALSRGIIALLKAAGHAADCAKDGDLSGRDGTLLSGHPGYRLAGHFGI